MPNRKRNIFYSVAKGRIIGIFTEWSQCEESIHKYHNCVFKGHKTLDEAIKFMIPSGFDCKTVTIYDENMSPKKANDLGHKCENCSDITPSTDDNMNNSESPTNDNINDTEAFDLSETFFSDIEETCPKIIDLEETTPKSIDSNDQPSQIYSCLKSCMKPYNKAMLQCSSCYEWVHFKCSELPIYMLYSLVNSKRKFTCVNCVDITDEWLAVNEDLQTGKIFDTVDVQTEDNIKEECDNLKSEKMYETVDVQTEGKIYETVDVQTENNITEEGKVYESVDVQTGNSSLNGQNTSTEITSAKEVQVKKQEDTFSIDEVKNHINDVVHQLELTLVNSLNNQKLNTNTTPEINNIKLEFQAEINNLKLELQSVKDEKQKVKNELKLQRQQLQESNAKTANSETEISNLKVELQTVREEKQKVKNDVKIQKQQLQEGKEKINKFETEINNLKLELQTIKDENQKVKNELKVQKQQLQEEKVKIANLQTENKKLNDDNKQQHQDNKQQHQATTSKLNNITSTINTINSTVSEVNTTITRLCTQIRSQEDTDETTHKTHSQSVQSRTKSQEDKQTDLSSAQSTAATGSRFSVLDTLNNDDLLITGVTFEQDKSMHSMTQSQQNSSCKNDKILLLGNSHLSPIFEENFIKDLIVVKQTCFTIEEGTNFLQKSDDSYECIVLHFITNDVKKQSTNSCVEDFSKLIDLCSAKWSEAKIIVSTGLPRGDSSILNDKVHACNIKLQGQYIETENVSFCDNSSLGIRGKPNTQLF